jgi:8-oxo-dGTP pyrophosphatase MutT (NUDIX family)
MKENVFPYEKHDFFSVKNDTNMQLSTLLMQLTAHCPFDEIEAAHLTQTLAFVSTHPDKFWRRNLLTGHITASAFVVNKEHSHALLLHHAALGKWLQPGGHVDDADKTPRRAAMREAIEETSADIEPTSMTDGSVETLYDVDVHPIPARDKNGQREPAHLHYDLRYLLIARQQQVRLSDESHDFRWLPIAQLADGRMESGITRMARKLAKA